MSWLKREETATVIAVGLLLMGCTTPPAQYHDVVQHPFEVREVVRTLDLTDPATAGPQAEQFAAARPNNGSSFVITADQVSARQLRASLLTAGVSARDIRVVAAAHGMTIERRDRIATVAGCTGGPRSMFGVWSIDDGYGHDNANSALLGCAVRRNIAAMTDDPRTLVIAEPAGGRDGARAAAVYDNWAKGEPTASHTILPTERTATTGADAGSGQ